MGGNIQYLHCHPPILPTMRHHAFAPPRLVPVKVFLKEHGITVVLQAMDDGAVNLVLEDNV